GDYFGYCVVAAGKGEIYAEVDLKPWDVAPMKILVEEAGGRLTDFAGKPDIYGGSVLATNGLLHDEALRLLTSGQWARGELMIDTKAIFESAHTHNGCQDKSVPAD